MDQANRVGGKPPALESLEPGVSAPEETFTHFDERGVGAADDAAPEYIEVFDVSFDVVDSGSWAGELSGDSERFGRRV
jgi:hypothetical protein